MEDFFGGKYFMELGVAIRPRGSFEGFVFGSFRNIFYRSSWGIFCFIFSRKQLSMFYWDNSYRNHTNKKSQQQPIQLNHNKTIHHKINLNKFPIFISNHPKPNKTQNLQFSKTPSSYYYIYIYITKDKQMTTQAIPTLMFVHENTDELIDRRIGRKQIFVDDKTDWQYKFRSQIKLIPGYEIDEDDGQTTIFNIVYSNRVGMVIYNSNKGIVGYDLQGIEGIVYKREDKKPKLLTKVRGSLFLSPKETKLLVINEQSILLFQLKNGFPLLKTLPNSNKVTNACWQNNDEQIYLWSFQNSLYTFSVLQDQLKKVDNVEKCSGVNRLGEKRIIVLEGVKVYIYIQKVRVKTVDIQKKHAENGTFMFMCLIGIAKLTNIDKEQLTADDIYIMIGVYYTEYAEGDEQPCARNIFYMKGDLYDDDNLVVRGNEIIFSSTDNESLYLAEDQTTRFPFSCLFSSNQNFIAILVEKMQDIYLVDAHEQFKKLSIFSTWPRHNFRIPMSLPNVENNKYLRGMATMQNMMPFESKAAPNDPISSIYCNDKFKGQFFRVYFTHREADLTIQFPLSIFTATHEFMFRKYAACTAVCCEEDVEQQIVQFVNKVKKSRYILPVKDKLKFKEQSDEGSMEISEKKQQVKKQSPKQLKQQVKKESPKQLKQQEKKQEEAPKSDEKKIKQKEVEQKIFTSKNFTQQEKEETIKTEQKQPITQKQQKIEKKESPKSGNSLFTKPIQITGPSLLSTSDAFKGLSMFKPTEAQKTTNEDKKQGSKLPTSVFGDSTSPILAGGGGIFGGIKTFPFGGSGSSGVFGSKDSTLSTMTFGDKSIFGGGTTVQNADKKNTTVSGLGLGQGFGLGNKIESILPKSQQPSIPKDKPASSLFSGMTNMKTPTDLFGKPTNPSPIQPIPSPLAPKTSSTELSLGGLGSAFANSMKISDDSKTKEKDKVQPPSIFNTNPLKNQPTTGTLSLPTTTGNFSLSNPKPVPPVIPPPPQKKQDPILTSKPTGSNNLEENKKKLKEKLEYFANLAKTVQNRIQTYSSDQKAPQLFNLKNAEKLLNNWSQIFPGPQDDAFDKIGNVLRKMESFENYKNSKLFKNKSQQEQKKDVIRNFESVDKSVDTLCYFVSFFESSDGKQKKSVFGPSLSKPRADAGLQQQKFMGALNTRVKQLEKQAENLKKNYQQKLASVLQVQKKPSKKTKAYNFDASQIESSESDESQTQEQKLIQKLKTQKQMRRVDQQRRQNKQVNHQDIAMSLERHESRIQLNQKPKKPFIFITPLDEPVSQKDLNNKSMAPKIKPLQPLFTQPQPKPFDSKLSNIGIKLEGKKTIPDLNSIVNDKEKQIVKSQSGSDSGEDIIPVVPPRTISKVPIVGGDKKKDQTPSFGLSGTPSAKVQPTAKKQQKPKQTFGLFNKQSGTTMFGGAQSASFSGNILGNGKKPEQPKQQPKQKQSKQQPKKQPQPKQPTTKPTQGLLTNTKPISEGLFGKGTAATQNKTPVFGGLTSGGLTSGGGLFSNKSTVPVVSAVSTGQTGKDVPTKSLFGNTKQSSSPNLNMGTPSLFAPTKTPDNKQDKKQPNKQPTPAPASTSTSVPTLTPTNKQAPTQTTSTTPSTKLFSIPSTTTTTTTATQPTPTLTTTQPKTQPIKQEQTKPSNPVGPAFAKTDPAPPVVPQPNKQQGSNKPVTNMFKDIGANQTNIFNNPQPTQNPLFSNTPNNSNNNNAPSQSQQTTLQFNQNAPTTMIPGHASTQFGSGNRFTNMGSGQQPVQQQTSGWNPNQMKFGGDNANASGLKTFGNVGGSGASWANSANTGQQPSWATNTSQSNNTNTNTGMGMGMGMGMGNSQGNSWTNNTNPTNTGNSWLNQNPTQPQPSWTNNNTTTNNPFSSTPSQSQPFSSNPSFMQPSSTSTSTTNNPWGSNPMSSMTTGAFQNSTSPMMGPGGSNINQSMFQPRK